MRTNRRLNSGIMISLQYLHFFNPILYSVSLSFWTSPCQLSFHLTAGEEIIVSQDWFLYGYMSMRVIAFQLFASYNTLSFSYFLFSAGDDHQTVPPSPVKSSQWWASLSFAQHIILSTNGLFGGESWEMTTFIECLSVVQPAILFLIPCLKCSTSWFPSSGGDCLIRLDWETLASEVRKLSFGKQFFRNSNLKTFSICPF